MGFYWGLRSSVCCFAELGCLGAEIETCGFLGLECSSLGRMRAGGPATRPIYSSSDSFSAERA